MGHLAHIIIHRPNKVLFLAILTPMVKQASKTITVRVPESKYRFVMELLDNLEFVEIEEPSKEQLIQEIKQGFKEANLMKKGKLPKKAARKLIHQTMI